MAKVVINAAILHSDCFANMATNDVAGLLYGIGRRYRAICLNGAASERTYTPTLMPNQFVMTSVPLTGTTFEFIFYTSNRHIISVQILIARANILSHDFLRITRLRWSNEPVSGFNVTTFLWPETLQFAASGGMKTGYSSGEALVVGDSGPQYATVGESPPFQDISDAPGRHSDMGLDARLTNEVIPADSSHGVLINVSLTWQDLYNHARQVLNLP